MAGNFVRNYFRPVKFLLSPSTPKLKATGNVQRKLRSDSCCWSFSNRPNLAESDCPYWNSVLSLCIASLIVFIRAPFEILVGTSAGHKKHGVSNLANTLLGRRTKSSSPLVLYTLKSSCAVIFNKVSFPPVVSILFLSCANATPSLCAVTTCTRPGQSIYEQRTTTKDEDKEGKENCFSEAMDFMGGMCDGWAGLHRPVRPDRTTFTIMTKVRHSWVHRWEMVIVFFHNEKPLFVTLTHTHTHQTDFLDPRSKQVHK